MTTISDFAKQWPQLSESGEQTVAAIHSAQRVEWRGGEAALRLDIWEAKDIENDAVRGLGAMNADDRQQLRTYYTELWLWNRLEQNRWDKAKLALRQQNRAQNRLEVDHIVAWDLWQSKLQSLQARQLTRVVGHEQAPVDELGASANELGNCVLLEKNFNIVKSNR